MINLILISKINAQAASYPATTSFTYNYQGYDYQFYFSGEVESPWNYRFDSSALDYLINKASEGLNLSISSGLGAKIDWVSGIVLSSVFDFYRNFVIATDKVVADWIVWSDIYGFTYTFTGIDSSYSGYETYGDAYGWRFTGWLGEKIDLVLDSQGMLYGSNPIGNYTFSDDQRDFGTWSIHQHDGDDIWLAPHVSSFEDLPTPYFVGTTVNLTYFDGDNQKHLYQVSNFTRCILGLYHSYSSGGKYYCTLTVYSDVNDLNSHQFYLDGVQVSKSFTTGRMPVRIDGDVHNYQGANLDDAFTAGNLPSHSINLFNPNFNSYNYRTANIKGILNSNIVNGSVSSLWLDSLSTTPLPDPIVLPVDDPIPVSDIDPDPIVFDPDPGDDPDPVPGIDYPVPGPTPVPVPPVPPLVSGNDDLWPDMNEVFAIESDMDSYLGGLSNFQFTPLRTLVEGFSSALMWVSTIMMALYNGTDFSVLFVVLSIFFIAAALLGIYKWWTH